ncbi:MAG: isocitrate/isopropylmalate dehydrogenase family protein [Burkholderiaceae bacterium]
MTPMEPARIALLAGDGIGVEVCDAVRAVADALQQRLPVCALQWQALPAGAGHYRDHGQALPAATLSACEQADAIFLGAMGLPEIRYPDGTEISPQLDLREHFDLYAGVRPIRSLAGIPRVLADTRAADIDLVLVREQTEGLFFDRRGTRVDEQGASDTLRITAEGAHRISRYAFELARHRRSPRDRAQVTLVDKANGLGSMAYFRARFLEIAEGYADIDHDCAYIDATALNLVRKPWAFDVMVTENQFGDILSDLCAALIGGMGLAPSADIGDRHAMFQPAHGSAPDIAGRGIANPTAAILSAAMMLDWLGLDERRAGMRQGAALISAAVDHAFASGACLPGEFGGHSGTAEITAAVVAGVRELPLPGNR